MLKTASSSTSFIDIALRIERGGQQKERVSSSSKNNIFRRNDIVYKYNDNTLWQRANVHAIIYGLPWWPLPNNSRRDNILTTLHNTDNHGATDFYNFLQVI